MTAQMMEILTLDGEDHGMAAEPFFLYFAKMRIEFHPYMHSTAFWRGYRGHWEIADGKLYLVRIEGHGEIFERERFEKGRRELRRDTRAGLITPQHNQRMIKMLKKACYKEVKFTLETFFPGQQRVFADWVTDRLRVPQGDILHYVHAGYFSVYERDLFLDIQEGVLVGREIVTNDPSKPPSFLF